MHCGISSCGRGLCLLLVWRLLRIQSGPSVHLCSLLRGACTWRGVAGDGVRARWALVADVNFLLLSNLLKQSVVVVCDFSGSPPPTRHSLPLWQPRLAPLLVPTEDGLETSSSSCHPRAITSCRSSSPADSPSELTNPPSPTSLTVPPRTQGLTPPSRGPVHFPAYHVSRLPAATC